MIEEKLAKYVSGITFQNINPENIHIIKRNILDSYAGICASLLDIEMIKKFDKLTSLSSIEKGLTVWGLNRKAITTDAIFCNTILGRRSDLVNTYMSPNKMGASHPSDNVSLVLSISDLLDKNGKDVLTYTYISYILSCAYADYYNPMQNKFDHDAQVLFFIPLIIGYAMGLSVHQLTESQRIAGMFGLNINQSCIGEITDWRHCTYASCAVSSIHSVKMALADFEGPKEIYEGEAGINQFIPHSQSILDPLPDLNSIIFKQWPALVFCQTPIDIAVEISNKIDNYQLIDHVDVQIYKLAIETAGVDSSYHPNTRAGRTHSLPYCIATALIKKTVEYSYFNDDFIKKEKDIVDLIPKIKVTENNEMTQKFPDGAPCKIIVTMKDGKKINCYKDFPHGDPQDPLSDNEIEEKVYKYLSIYTDNTKEIIERVWNLENESSIEWLVAPLKQLVL